MVMELGKYLRDRNYVPATKMGVAILHRHLSVTVYFSEECNGALPKPSSCLTLTFRFLFGWSLPDASANLSIASLNERGAKEVSKETLTVLAIDNGTSHDMTGVSTHLVTCVLTAYCSALMDWFTSTQPRYCVQVCEQGERERRGEGEGRGGRREERKRKGGGGGGGDRCTLLSMG